jgi:hypothetical protein
MKIDKHLRKQGFDFYSERTKQEATTEIWVNKGISLGGILKWFRLER